LLAKKDVELSKQQVLIEKTKLLPDFMIGYFNQSLRGIPLENGNLATAGNRFQGINGGIQIPVWTRPQMARIRSAEKFGMASQAEMQSIEIQLGNQLKMAIQEFNKLKNQLDFIEKTALPTSNLIRKQALLSLEKGSSGFLELAPALKQSLMTGEELILTRNKLIQSKFYIQYLTSTP